MLKTLALGLPVGLLFGYALQRGRFCMYSAFRDLFFARDFTLFRAYIMALFVQMAIIHGLDAAGYLTVRPFGFTWLAAIVGGLIFGAGISLAGGCASGNWYRIGEGMVGSILAVLGYGLGVSATFWGPLNPLSTYLRAFRAPSALGSLQGLTGLPKWTAVIALILGFGGVWLARSPRPKVFTGWPWTKAGVVIGLIASFAWIASAEVGRNFGMSFTGPSGMIIRYVTTGQESSLSWDSWMIIGVPMGAFISAAWSNEFKWRAPAPDRMAKQLVGGLMMGFGAATAGGCNIEHSLTGLAALSTTSLLATIFIILGSWLGTYIFFMRR
ncbi:MAG: YeeE/YedE family protein [Nitrospinota bacterium]|nr:YeeE/YedE family protein [Nitrospinota bacterium]